MRGDVFPRLRYDKVKRRSRGRLPHWEMEGGVYSVTFRLADSLPQDVLHELVEERDRLLRRAGKSGVPLTDADRRRIEAAFSQEVDDYLDQGVGACWLARPEIASLVQDALVFFEGERYRLFAWCVMPNHVHVVFQPFAGSAPQDIIHGWKSYTASRANRLIGRNGAFWQRESFDRLVRDEIELARVVEYVARNPGAARSAGWPWVWVQGRDAGKSCRSE